MGSTNVVDRTYAVWTHEDERYALVAMNRGRAIVVAEGSTGRVRVSRRSLDVMEILAWLAISDEARTTTAEILLASGSSSGHRAA
jgi:hypothetical protein